jgi:hypothetical protein
MLGLRKRSSWSFETSQSRGGSYGIFSAGLGDLFLRSPDGGRFVFSYASGGVGLSLGVKVNLTYGTPESWSAGQIFLLDTFSGNELTAADFQGVCLIQDGSIGAGIGASGDVMAMGASPAALPHEIVQLAVGRVPVVGELVSNPAGPLGAVLAARNGAAAVWGAAKAVLLMAGFNAGPQLQVGTSDSIGWVYAGGETVASIARRVARQRGVPLP